MAERVKVKLNYKGVGQLLKSSEMQALLAQHAGQIAGRCGSGYETDGFVAQTRAARADNARSNTILKALK